MGRLKLIFLTDEYNDYMVKHCCAYARKSVLNMTRPYVMLPERINGHLYCIPLSSPKKNDYFVRMDGSIGIKDDMITRVRLVGPNSETGKNDVLGSLILSRMIPVPESEIVLCDFTKRVCSIKKMDLLKQELQCAEEKIEYIVGSAELFHKAMTDSKDSTPKHRRIREKFEVDALNLNDAEAACLKYKRHLERGLSREQILATVFHLPDMEFEDKKRRENNVSDGSFAGSTDEHGAVGGAKPKRTSGLGDGSVSPKTTDVCDSARVEKSCQKFSKNNPEQISPKIVFVSKCYIEYMAKKCESENYVSKVKGERPFFQLPYKVNGHTYCIPISSAKSSDYFTGRLGEQVVKPDSLHIMRLFAPNTETKQSELKGTLRIGNMIPVPESQLIPFVSKKSEFSKNYETLIQKQKRYIKENMDKITSYSLSLYNMKLGKELPSELFLRMEKYYGALEFDVAEQACKEFEQCLEQGISEQEILKLVRQEYEASSLRKQEEQSAKLPAKSAWDKPLSFGQSTPEEVDKSLGNLSLTDGAVGGAAVHRLRGYEDGSVRRKVLEARGGRGRSSSQSIRQHTQQDSGRGKGRGRGRTLDR